MSEIEVSEEEIIDQMRRAIALLAEIGGMDKERVAQIRRGEPIYARYRPITASLTGDVLDLSNDRSLLEELSEKIFNERNL